MNWLRRPKPKQTDEDDHRFPGGALLGALLAFSASPVLHMRRDAVEQAVAALGMPPAENGPTHVYVGSRPVPVAYWQYEGSILRGDEEPEAQDLYDITAEGVAIIPVCGTLVSWEPEYWFRWYGYASTPLIGRMLDAAALDARVKSILLVVKSPGGHTAGISEVAAKVWALRQGEKRILAWGEDICSAAYHIASQAEKVYLSASGFGGCIGTLMTPTDYSGLWEMNGISRKRITSTGAEKFKGAGVFGTAVTKEMEADWKRVCDEIQALFSGDVMRARGFSAEEMLARATGQYWVGANCTLQKLVDGVATATQVLTALGSGGDVECEGCTPAPGDDSDLDEADDTTTEEIKMDEKVQQSLADKIVAGMTKLFASNKPDPAQEELAKLKAEASKLQADNEAREKEALTSARGAALAAATAAYAPGTPELESATKVINGASDIAVLAELTSAYTAKASAKPVGRQTTTPPTGSATPPAAPESDKTELTSQDYTDIYAQYNKKGA